MALGLSQPAIASGIVAVEEIPLIEAGIRGADQRVAAALCERVGIPLDPSQPVLDVEHAAATEIEAALRRGEWRVCQESLPVINADAPQRWLYAALMVERQGDFAGALQLLESVLASPAELSFRLRAAVAICRCSRNVGNLLRSLEVAEDALDSHQADPAVDFELVSELRATLAGTYCETGDLVRALDLSSPDPLDVRRSPWSIATQRWSRAMVLQSTGQFAEAVTAAFEALDILQSLNQPRTATRMQNIAAWIVMQTPGFDVALVDRLLRSAEETFRDEQAPVELAFVLTSRAELAARDGDALEAASCAGEAVALATGEDVGFRARIMAAAAHVYASIGDVDTAMRHLLTARELLEGSGARRSAAGTWQQMAATYAAMGQEDLRLACLRAAMDLLDL